MQQQRAKFARRKVRWIQTYLALRASQTRCKNAQALEVAEDTLRARKGNAGYPRYLAGISLLEERHGQENARPRRGSKKTKPRVFHERIVPKMWSRDNKNDVK